MPFLGLALSKLIFFSKKITVGYVFIEESFVILTIKTFLWILLRFSFLIFRYEDSIGTYEYNKR